MIFILLPANAQRRKGISDSDFTKLDRLIGFQFKSKEFVYIDIESAGGNLYVVTLNTKRGALIVLESYIVNLNPSESCFKLELTHGENYKNLQSSYRTIDGKLNKFRPDKLDGKPVYYRSILVDQAFIEDKVPFYTGKVAGSFDPNLQFLHEIMYIIWYGKTGISYAKIALEDFSTIEEKFFKNKSGLKIAEAQFLIVEGTPVSIFATFANKKLVLSVLADSIYIPDISIAPLKLKKNRHVALSAYFENGSLTFWLPNEIDRETKVYSLSLDVSSRKVITSGVIELDKAELFYNYSNKNHDHGLFAGFGFLQDLKGSSGEHYLIFNRRLLINEYQTINHMAKDAILVLKVSGTELMWARLMLMEQSESLKNKPFVAENYIYIQVENRQYSIDKYTGEFTFELIPPLVPFNRDVFR